MGNRIDLGEGYMVIEGEDDGYSIVTPSGNVELPNSIFWRMVTGFCPRALRGDITVDDNYTWTEDNTTLEEAK